MTNHDGEKNGFLTYLHILHVIEFLPWNIIPFGDAFKMPPGKKNVKNTYIGSG